MNLKCFVKCMRYVNTKTHFLNFKQSILFKLFYEHFKIVTSVLSEKSKLENFCWPVALKATRNMLREAARFALYVFLLQTSSVKPWEDSNHIPEVQFPFLLRTQWRLVAPEAGVDGHNQLPRDGSP